MQLHILNGDATLRPFIESKIAGDVVIWREILSEGPAKNVSTQEFFQLRAEYIHQAFKSNMQNIIVRWWMNSER